MVSTGLGDCSTLQPCSCALCRIFSPSISAGAHSVAGGVQRHPDRIKKWLSKTWHINSRASRHVFKQTQRHKGTSNSEHVSEDVRSSPLRLYLLAALEVEKRVP